MKGQWFPTVPSIQARSTQLQSDSDLRVSNLLASKGVTWDESKLHELVHPEDIQHIKLMRPSLLSYEDSISWVYKKDGIIQLNHDIIFNEAQLKIFSH